MSRAVMSVAPAGRHDQVHRPRRIGLRPRDTQHRWQRSSAHGQMQELSTGKFHFRTSLQARATYPARSGRAPWRWWTIFSWAGILALCNSQFTELEGHHMTRLFVRHNVADYRVWRKAYDDFDEERRKLGV